jgi:hypothetical protein
MKKKKKEKKKRKTNLGRFMKLLSPNCNACLIDHTRLGSSIVKRKEEPFWVLAFRHSRQ